MNRNKFIRLVSTERYSLIKQIASNCCEIMYVMNPSKNIIEISENYSLIKDNDNNIDIYYLNECLNISDTRINSSILRSINFCIKYKLDLDRNKFKLN